MLTVVLTSSGEGFDGCQKWNKEKVAATLLEVEVLLCASEYLRIFLLDLNGLKRTSVHCCTCANGIFPSEKDMLMRGGYPGSTVAELVNSVFSPSHKIAALALSFLVVSHGIQLKVCC